MEQDKSSSIIGLTAKGKQRQYVQHAYQDRSHEDDGPLSKKDEVILKQYDENRVGGAFPLKLHIILKILEKEGKDHIFSWLPHGRAFGIHRNGEFEEEVVKRFFKQSQISSFRRQLNLYGFLRISSGRDCGAYYHEMFLRGKPLLSMKMVRTRIKGTKIRASSSPDSEPLFYSMPFLGPSVRPEFSALSATVQTQMSSINPSFTRTQRQHESHAMIGAMNPLLGMNVRGGGANLNSSVPGVHGVASSSAMNQTDFNRLHQNQISSISMPGNFMNSFDTMNGTESIVNRRRALELIQEQNRLEQELINNMRNDHHNTANNYQQSMNPMNIRSNANMNVTNRMQASLENLTENSNNPIRSNDPLQSGMQQQAYPLISMNTLHAAHQGYQVPRSNAPGLLSFSRFPGQRMGPHDLHSFPGGDMQNQRYQEMGQTSRRSDLLFPEQNSVMTQAAYSNIGNRMLQEQDIPAYTPRHANNYNGNSFAPTSGSARLNSASSDGKISQSSSMGLGPSPSMMKMGLGSSTNNGKGNLKVGKDETLPSRIKGDQSSGRGGSTGCASTQSKKNREHPENDKDGTKNDKNTGITPV